MGGWDSSSFSTFIFLPGIVSHSWQHPTAHHTDQALAALGRQLFSRTKPVRSWLMGHVSPGSTAHSWLAEAGPASGGAMPGASFL